jgi:hypothetical protein
MGNPSGGVLMRKRISGSPANRAAGPACPEISRSQGRYGRIEIQPNAIPGDDGQDDLHTLEHPAVRVLLLTNTAAAEPTLHTRVWAPCKMSCTWIANHGAPLLTDNS